MDALKGEDQDAAKVVFRNVDSRIVESTVRGETTPLHKAARWGQLYSVMLLVQSGASMDSQDEEGQTPLHLAIIEGHEKVVRWLLNEGASARLRDFAGRTPLDVASAGGLLWTVVEEHARMQADDDERVRALASEAAPPPSTDAVASGADSSVASGADSSVAAGADSGGLLDVSIPKANRSRASSVAAPEEKWDDEGSVLRESAQCYDVQPVIGVGGETEEDWLVYGSGDEDDSIRRSTVDRPTGGSIVGEEVEIELPPGFQPDLYVSASSDAGPAPAAGANDDVRPSRGAGGGSRVRGGGGGGDGAPSGSDSGSGGSRVGGSRIGGSMLNRVAAHGSSSRRRVCVAVVQKAFHRVGDVSPFAGLPYLKMQVGDVVNVVEADDSGWWEGELHGVLGVFPSKYVERVDGHDGGGPAGEDARAQRRALSQLPSNVLVMARRGVDAPPTAAGGGGRPGGYDAGAAWHADHGAFLESRLRQLLRKGERDELSALYWLPDEVLLRILGHLSCFDLIRASHACSLFMRLSRNTALWGAAGGGYRDRDHYVSEGFRDVLRVARVRADPGIEQLPPDHEYAGVLKVLVVGAEASGKTAFRHRIVRNEWPPPKRQGSHDFDCLSAVYSVDGFAVKLGLWDVTRASRATGIYKGVVGVFVCARVDQEESWESIAGYMGELDRYCPRAERVIVGTHFDVLEVRGEMERAAMFYEHVRPLCRSAVVLSSMSGLNTARAVEVMLRRLEDSVRDFARRASKKSSSSSSSSSKGSSGDPKDRCAVS